MEKVEFVFDYEINIFLLMENALYIALELIHTNNIDLSNNSSFFNFKLLISVIA